MSTLQTRRSGILGAIAAMPPKLSPDRARLDLVTKAFLDRDLFADAVLHGWTDRELFAVDPVRCTMRPDRAGLVSGIALSALTVPKLLRIKADAAIIECGDKGGRSILTHRRGPVGYLGTPWWFSPELGGRLPETQGEQVAA